MMELMFLGYSGLHSRIFIVLYTMKNVIPQLKLKYYRFDTPDVQVDISYFSVHGLPPAWLWKLSIGTSTVLDIGTTSALKSVLVQY